MARTLQVTRPATAQGRQPDQDAFIERFTILSLREREVLNDLASLDEVRGKQLFYFATVYFAGSL